MDQPTVPEGEVISSRVKEDDDYYDEPCKCGNCEACEQQEDEDHESDLEQGQAHIRDGIIAKVLGTAIAGFVCSYWMTLNHGNSGIGWFMLALFMIW